MSRFLIVTWDGAGNLVSTLGVAERLVQRGHDVRLLGHRSIDDRCGSRGWRFRPFIHTVDFDSTTATEASEEQSTLGRGLWFSADVAADVRQELEREAADVVLADCMLFGALSAGQAAGVPTAALFHSPFSVFRGGPLVEMLSPHFPAVQALRDDLGLPPVGGMAEVHDSCDLSLVAMPRELELDMPLPSNVRFIGPVLDGPPIMTQADNLEIGDGPQPRVLVSFSTSYQDQLDVLQRVVRAIGELDANVVVTTGPAIAADAIGAEANTSVVQFVEHHRLLRQTTAVVTHGGLGTVLTALSHGVPLVCMPMGRDQYFNAAMVERVGAGRTIDMNADPDAIRAAVRSVIDDSAMKVAANSVAGVIAGYGGADEAVRKLEQLAPSEEKGGPAERSGRVAPQRRGGP